MKLIASVVASREPMSIICNHRLIHRKPALVRAQKATPPTHILILEMIDLLTVQVVHLTPSLHVLHVKIPWHNHTLLLQENDNVLVPMLVVAIH